MRTRTTVILALVLVIASVLLWIDTPTAPGPSGGDPSAGESGANQPPGANITRLLSFSSASIERITLQRGAFNATLTRTNGEWSGITDASVVKDFLHSLQELAQIIVVGPEEGGPSDYGLEPPVARVTLERSAEVPIELRIGHSNPTSTGVYAQLGTTGPVVLTGALVLWDFDKVVRALHKVVETKAN